jgi:hypothetical protein
MTKIGVMIVLSVLLIGCAIYFLGTNKSAGCCEKQFYFYYYRDDYCG